MTVGDIRAALRDLPDEAQVGFHVHYLDEVDTLAELGEIRRSGTRAIIHVDLRYGDPDDLDDDDDDEE